MATQKPPSHLPPTAIGTRQEIKARSGTATFVPKGHTIKIINSYGGQTVALWAFALHDAPTEEEMEDKPEEAEQVEPPAEAPVSSRSVSDSGDITPSTQTQDAQGEPKDGSPSTTSNDTTPQVAEIPENDGKGDDDRQKATLDGSGPKKAWTAYLPSVRGRSKQSTSTDDNQIISSGGEKNSSTPRTWTSYLPSVPESKKGTNERKTWASYIPSGHGFSSYIPRDALHAISEIHKRDPNKSVAEQLYDFSKTPAGAAGLSIATGSGYASSLFAAYSAYNRSTAAKADRRRSGMEFLSMSHTRASTLHMSPRVGDVFVTNIRAPLFTLVADTSPGTHDTLLAACDPLRYKELGASDWETHGSCAENLVAALHELNKKVGLKGYNAIGSDVSVNRIPDPLNLFVNIPAVDGELSFKSPKGKRGDYTKFRAERDVVVVMSACPQDITEVNNKRPMVAHFVVESPSEADRTLAEQRDKEAQEIIEKARKRMEADRQEVASVHQQRPQGRVPAKLDRPSSGHHSSIEGQQGAHGADSPARPKQPAPKPGRNRPKKLDRRASSASSAPKTE